MYLKLVYKSNVLYRKSIFWNHVVASQALAAKSTMVPAATLREAISTTLPLPVLATISSGRHSSHTRAPTALWVSLQDQSMLLTSRSWDLAMALMTTKASSHVAAPPVSRAKNSDCQMTSSARIAFFPSPKRFQAQSRFTNALIWSLSRSSRLQTLWLPCTLPKKAAVVGSARMEASARMVFVCAEMASRVNSAKKRRKESLLNWFGSSLSASSSHLLCWFTSMQLRSE